MLISSTPFQFPEQECVEFVWAGRVSDLLWRFVPASLLWLQSSESLHAPSHKAWKQMQGQAVLKLRLAIIFRIPQNFFYRSSSGLIIWALLWTPTLAFCCAGGMRAAGNSRP